MVCAGNGYLYYHKGNLYQVKVLVVFFFTSVIIGGAKAQTHDEFWSRLSLVKNIHRQWNATLDLNLRQQSNYWVSSKNNFELPMMRSARLWLFCNPGKKYSLTNTIAIAETVDIKENKNALLKATELIYGIGISRKDSLKNIQIKNRLLAEIKKMQPQTGNHVTMLRYRLQNSVAISVKQASKQSALFAIVNSELFFKTREKDTGFDQYRISGSLQWRLHNAECTIGLQETFQEQDDQLQKRNQLLFYVTFYL